MTDILIEIRNDTISVEEIMQKIRENIRKRQATGELPLDPDIQLPNPRDNPAEENTDEMLQRNLAYLHSSWDIHNYHYYISSHRPYIGKLLVKGRNLVHGEVRRYVDPMISKQSGFNKSTDRIFSRLFQKIEQTDETLAQAIRAHNDAITRLEHVQKKTIEENTLKAVTALNPEITRKAWLLKIFEDRIRTAENIDSKIHPSQNIEGLHYLSFENQFRGSYDDIYGRQKYFIKYFEGCNNVLDIGCGRGEFLELMKEHDIRARGIDIDDGMVEYCCLKELNVEKTDAVSCLEHLDDNSLDGIFIDQVIEHLEPAYMVRLLSLCYQKIREGCHIVIETINPLSFVSFSNFFIDLTHKRPVHPQTLEFLVSSAGFKGMELHFLSPVQESSALHCLPEDGLRHPEDKEWLTEYNRNIRILNSVLFGPQDYAVVAKK